MRSEHISILREKSAPAEDRLNEAKTLLDQSVRDLTLDKERCDVYLGMVEYGPDGLPTLREEDVDAWKGMLDLVYLCLCGRVWRGGLAFGSFSWGVDSVLILAVIELGGVFRSFHRLEIKS